MLVERFVCHTTEELAVDVNVHTCANTAWGNIAAVTKYALGQERALQDQGQGAASQQERAEGQRFQGRRERSRESDVTITTSYGAVRHKREWQGGFESAGAAG